MSSHQYNLCSCRATQENSAKATEATKMVQAMPAAARAKKKARETQIEAIKKEREAQLRVEERTKVREEKDQERKKAKQLRRVSSKHAASILSKPMEGLVIVTTDASAAQNQSNGTSGSAAYIRQFDTINAGGLPCSSGSRVKGAVLWHPFAESGPAEIAAVALGADTVMDEGLTDRVVLIICDSNLDFFDPKGQLHKLECELESAAKYKASVARLVNRSTEVTIAKVRSNHTRKQGFQDHESADKLAGKARNKDFAASYKCNWKEGDRLNAKSLDWLRQSEETRKRQGRRVVIPTSKSLIHIPQNIGQLGVDSFLNKSATVLFKPVDASRRSLYRGMNAASNIQGRKPTFMSSYLYSDSKVCNKRSKENDRPRHTTALGDDQIDNRMDCASETKKDTETCNRQDKSIEQQNINESLLGESQHEKCNIGKEDSPRNNRRYWRRRKRQLKK